MRAAAIISLLSGSTALAQQSDIVDESSQVFILSPDSLAGEYDHLGALYGSPPYGSSINGQLYYVGSTLCEEPMDMDDIVDGGYILIVDRGECSFVRKTRIAQQMGASAVIVADNTCLCSSQECVDQNFPDLETCETLAPILADDGSGGDITIPSVFLFKQDVDPIIAAILAGENVHAALSWRLVVPPPSQVVDVELFSLPYQDELFLTQFRDVVLALGNSVMFTPRDYIFDGIAVNCYDGSGQNLCSSLCTNNGRYCATGTGDIDVVGRISGATFVEEALRRLCIWNVYNELDDGCGEVWWDYVIHFNRLCVNTLFPDSRCIRTAFRHACVDETLVWNCMKESGGLEGDVENVLLEETIAAQRERGVVTLPSVFVNSIPYTSGQVTALNIFRAICTGFSNGNDPFVCELCANPRCRDPLACVSTGQCF